jgi:hypothetical protein
MGACFYWRGIYCLNQIRMKKSLNRYYENGKCGNRCVENAGDYCSVMAARQNLKILPLVIY